MVNPALEYFSSWCNISQIRVSQHFWFGKRKAEQSPKRIEIEKLYQLLTKLNRRYGWHASTWQFILKLGQVYWRGRIGAHLIGRQRALAQKQEQFLAGSKASIAILYWHRRTGQFPILTEDNNFVYAIQWRYRPTYADATLKI